MAATPTPPSESSTPPDGGVFLARTRVMDDSDVSRALRRMAHAL